MITIAFLIASLIVVILPGPGSIYTIATGLSRGRIKSLYASLGCTISILPHLILGIIGLSLLNRLDQHIFIFITILGAIYLLYLGYSMIRSGFGFDMDTKEKDGSGLTIALKAIFINLLNPKLTLFFLSFIPQFIDSDRNDVLLQAVILGLVFMLISLLVFIVYGLLSSTFHRFLSTSPERMIIVQRVFGSLFILFAIRLLFQN